MTTVCEYKEFSIYADSRLDPTRTLTLRNAFASQMGSRFNNIKKLIRKAIIDDDCFGLKKQDITTFQSSPGRNAFDFPMSADKVEAFMRWFEEVVEDELLEVTYRFQLGKPINEVWANLYVRQAYERGIARARRELRIAGFDVPSLEDTGGLQAAFYAPFHMDRVGLIFLRAYTELKGITDDMGSQISKILAQGIAEGRNPNELARLLVRTLTGPDGGLGITDTLGRYIPAERRAKILARTEIIRAHHVATIQEYRNWGVLGVKVKAEWQTAGDNRVCGLCMALEGRVFELDEIESKIPFHPMCRCCALPVDVTDQ